MSNATATQDPTATIFSIRFDPERAVYWELLGFSDTDIERLRRIHSHSESALIKLIDLALELETHRETQEPLAALEAFIADAADFSDAVERLAAIYTIEILGDVRPKRFGGPGLKADPWPGWVNPQDPHRRRRVLGPVEMGLIRLVAMKRSQLHEAIIGLGEASAALGELGQITADMIDIHTRCVRLPGTSRIAARTMALPAWASDAIIDIAVDHAGDPKPMLYAGKKGKQGMLDTLCMNAGNVLRQAGLGDPSASFESMRNTAARNVLDSAGADAAVQFLGEKNYERVLTKLGKRPAPARRQR